MSTSNPFANLYKTYTDAQLLEILQMAEHYQPEAVKAAEAEMDSRALTTHQLQQAGNELERKRLGPLADIEIVQGKESVKDKITGIFWPDKPTEEKLNRRIYLFSICFGLLCLNLVIQLRDIFYFRGVPAQPLNVMEIFQIGLTLFIIISTILFFMRKKAGWLFFMLMFCTVMGTTGVLTLTTLVKGMGNAVESFSLLSSLIILGFAAFLISFLLHGPLRQVYNITKPNIKACVIIAGSITLAYLAVIVKDNLTSY
jgi:hypothetical protein